MWLATGGTAKSIVDGEAPRDEREGKERWEVMEGQNGDHLVVLSGLGLGRAIA